jgi:hypothetical protein
VRTALLVAAAVLLLLAIAAWAGSQRRDRGEIGWYRGGSWQSVWKGRILESTFEFDT